MNGIAAAFALPEPIRLVNSDPFWPSSMKLMNACARSGLGAALWITMLSTDSTAPWRGTTETILNDCLAAAASLLAWKNSTEYPSASQMLPALISLMYDDELNAAQHGLAFLISSAARL